ncbi:DUF2786 domain-containing protein [Cryptosporangium sp. NPDC051539]|uniref:DUF2786 domain-containing protein n=1 Tax=Cryptosporangium sp. NPDC051539 TaxID=3363962 RepID=UPI003787CC4D
MTVPSDAKLATIRKLLAQAEDTAASPAEAETFTAKAAELMARYGVDLAMLADGDSSADEIADRWITLDPPYALDKRDLLTSIARALGLRAILRTIPGGEISAMLFGYRSDLERSEILFTSLLLQAVRGMVATPVPPSENKAAFRRAWLAGFSATVWRRLQAAEQRAREEATESGSTSATGRSAELVLADRRSTVDAQFAEAFPRLGTARNRRLSSGRGHEAGVEAGARADLGHPGLSRRRALRH